jgi:hypothetical protein
MQGLDEYSRVSVRVCYEIESSGRSEWAFKVLSLLAYWYKSANTDASYGIQGRADENEQTHLPSRRKFIHSEIPDQVLI